MQALTLLQKFFSVDMVIYAAIVLVAATALARCTMPLSRVAARLRRGANHRHRKQAEQREKIVERHAFPRRFSFRDVGGFLQNAEMRDATARPAT